MYNLESYSEPSRRGVVEGVKGPGPVNILCHEILLSLYISAMHFYDNLSALITWVPEPSIAI